MREEATRNQSVRLLVSMALTHNVLFYKRRLIPKRTSADSASDGANENQNQRHRYRKRPNHTAILNRFTCKPFSIQLHPLIPDSLANSIGRPEKAGLGRRLGRNYPHRKGCMGRMNEVGITMRDSTRRAFGPLSEAALPAGTVESGRPVLEVMTVSATFEPRLDILPACQRRLWPELDAVPVSLRALRWHWLGAPARPTGFGRL